MESIAIWWRSPNARGRPSVNKYLVPKPITRRFELLAGWDLVQAGIAATGIVLGLLVFLVVAAVGLPVPLGLVGLTLCGGVGTMLALPQPGGQPPLYRRLQDGLAFKRRQARFLYDWGARDPD